VVVILAVVSAVVKSVLPLWTEKKAVVGITTYFSDDNGTF